MIALAGDQIDRGRLLARLNVAAGNPTTVWELDERRSWGADGYTDEEAKMWNETHKMIDPSIKLTVTCVRVPVMVGHSESVNIEFHDPIDEDEAREILRNAPMARLEQRQIAQMRVLIRQMGDQLSYGDDVSKSQLFKARAKLRRLLAPLVDTSSTGMDRSYAAPGF